MATTEPLDDLEAHRLATRINDLLAKMGYPDGKGTEWWMYEVHDELGGITALQAWNRGRHREVYALVESYVSKQYADALSANPEVVRRLRKRATS
ncbi:MAG TPA: hypothetical protein VN796_09330 [Acidimicrobiales bacterium]|nr:hypothetical protein [Acidimicrobiales bacterium]